MDITSLHIPFESRSKAGLFIDSVHEYRFNSDQPTELIPQGRFELIFQLEGEFLHRAEQDDSWFERPRAFIGGMHSRSYSVRAKGGVGRCFGVSIKPSMTHLLIRDNLNRFENSVIDIESVFGIEGKRLSEAVLNEQELKSKLSRIESFLSSFSEDNRSRNSTDLLTKSLAAADDCRIIELSHDLGMSESHFRRIFRELVGINAKRFFKIRRANRAIDLIQMDSTVQLTQIAYALGFYDQAHFIREFRSVTGRTPKHFLDRSI